MKKRIVTWMLSAAMAVSLLAACGSSDTSTDETDADVVSDETAGEETEETEEEAAEEAAEETGEETEEEVSDGEEIADGYIAAPYTAGDEIPEEYVEPVFYYNEDGPTISVTYVGVIVEDGLYFRDSDNDQELDVFEDWRLTTEERVEDLLDKLTIDQRTGLLQNSLYCAPAAYYAEDVYDEDGTVIMSQLLSYTEDNTSSYSVYSIIDDYCRSGVIRKDTDTETGALFNNALQMMTEYEAVVNGEVAVSYVLMSNPMTTGYPSSLGFGAAVTGDGSADALQAYAELDAEIWNAKGIRMMYGPQIDLITDPRWCRNSTTYTEDPDMMAEIATALVVGYQHGTDGAQEGDVALIVKHFPGDGASYNGFESHSIIGQYRVYPTEGSLENYQLVGFQAAIDAGVAGIMPGYSRDTTDARSATQTVNGVVIEAEELANAYSYTILTTLLRDVMGFEGFVNTDSMIVTSMTYGVEDLTEAERYALAINAGSDVIGDIGDNGLTLVGADYTDLIEAVESGLIEDEAFDRATTNRMTSWIELGMFENPYRDPAESKAVGEELADEIEESKEEFNHKSVVLMKNSEDVLPLSTGANVYVQMFNGTGVGTEDTVADELEAMGYTIVDDYTQADIAILMVVPATLSTSADYLQVIDLVEDLEVDQYYIEVSSGAAVATAFNSGEEEEEEEEEEETEDTSALVGTKTGDTVEVTTVADIDDLWEIADTVHANGGVVIGTINITSPWILTNLEPYCDALLGVFDTTDQAIADVIAGEYSPTGKLPVTMVSCNEVIAVVEETLEDGETYEICVSPNDVPGYAKDQYMDEEVLAQSPSGSYAYQDADGNYYLSGFGLTYSD